MPLATTNNTTPATRISCITVPPARPLPSLRDDVSAGFEARPRTIPPKYFYDADGSALFDRICDTPEYYPTRAEAYLLQRYARTILALVRPTHIVEFGSGSCRKTRYLLRAAAELGLPLRYWPFDVCEDMLLRAARALTDELDDLQVCALVGDYCGGLAHLPQPDGRCLYLFLGGTIGNFSAAESRQFLRELRARMRPGDALLLGLDRVKPRAVLEAAYNDRAGVTARFNLNLLNVLNRELDADFDPRGFRHQAVYRPERARIEMYLVSTRTQRVRIGALGRGYRFEAGEAVLTEISRKFTPLTLRRLLLDAGLALESHFEGGEQLYSLVLARKALAPWED